MVKINNKLIEIILLIRLRKKDLVDILVFYDIKINSFIKEINLILLGFMILLPLLIIIYPKLIICYILNHKLKFIKNNILDYNIFKNG